MTTPIHKHHVSSVAVQGGTLHTVRDPGINGRFAVTFAPDSSSAPAVGAVRQVLAAAAPTTVPLDPNQLAALAAAVRPAPTPPPKLSPVRRALLVAGALLGIAVAVAGGVVAGSAIAAQLPVASATTR